MSTAIAVSAGSRSCVAIYRSARVDQSAARVKKRFEDRRRDWLLEQLKLHPQRMAPGFRGIVGREGSARGRLQIERSELHPVRFGVETYPVRNRQPRLPQGSQVRGLRAEAAGVG